MEGKTLIDIIGNTPLVRLFNIEKEFNLNCKLYAKLERCNPTGSIKDRAAKYMLVNALKQGKINKDTLIIEPTSGNTGIGLAAIGASLGMKVVIFMPSSASKERVQMMTAFGAEVILVEGGMSECIQKANELHEKNHNSFIPSQFNNKDNLLAHYETTGPEIFNELNGNIDIFVAGFGTGGTLTGVSKYIKEKKNILSVGVEPSSSAFISSANKGPHKIQGIGAGFKPTILDLSYVDEIMTISDDEAYEFTRLLAKKEGLLGGISSGANLAASVKMAKTHPNLTIVTIFPDNGERYLSVSNLF